MLPGGGQGNDSVPQPVELRSLSPFNKASRSGVIKEVIDLYCAGYQ